MHLGNVFTALMSWLEVRSRDGSWILRIEDIDPQRSKPIFAEAIEDDLYWLGLRDWEGGLEDEGSVGPYCQSRRTDIYADAVRLLMQKGLVYPCSCTRAALQAIQAPHASDGTVIYPGTCRPQQEVPFSFGETDFVGRAVRVVVDDEPIAFIDRLCGLRTSVLSRDCGDMVLRRADGAWAYQLAVTVDDALMGVTQVVRGRDLLDSTARQLYLRRQLYGTGTEPEYMHLPLITDRTGRRLSKRDADLDMGSLRRDYAPEAIIGRLAYMAGLTDSPSPISAQALAVRYRPDALPPQLQTPFIAL